MTTPPLILHTEASTGLGGQEIRILGEVRWLLDHGWNALIACQPGSRLATEAASADLPVVTIAMRATFDLRALLRLRALMGSRGVDLVHTHSSIDSWLATAAAKSLGLPVVRGRHVTIPILKRRALIYRLADHVITTGEAVAARVRDAGVPATRISRDLRGRRHRPLPSRRLGQGGARRARARRGRARGRPRRQRARLQGARGVPRGRARGVADLSRSALPHRRRRRGASRTSAGACARWIFRTASS